MQIAFWTYKCFFEHIAYTFAGKLNYYLPEMAFKMLKYIKDVEKNKFFYLSTPPMRKIEDGEKCKKLGPLVG